jgi:16S rRNA (guanine1207-N2)-methyltransferase
VRGRLAGRVADLGAGWGYLAGEAFRDSPEIAELHLLEAEFSALQCARANVSDPRARFHWTDVIANPGEGGFDAVLCNPPFHSGKSTETSLGAGFIQAARRLLAPKGTAWFVANSHLPYEAVLNAAFARVEPLPRQGGYKIFAASLPRRP